MRAAAGAGDVHSLANALSALQRPSGGSACRERGVGMVPARAFAAGANRCSHQQQSSFAAAHAQKEVHAMEDHQTGGAEQRDVRAGLKTEQRVSERQSAAVEKGSGVFHGMRIVLDSSLAATEVHRWGALSPMSGALIQKHTCNIMLCGSLALSS